jgi:hypothetical protein
MKQIIRNFSVFTILGLLLLSCSGCPIPVPRTFVKLPECRITVTDKSGSPIEGALLTIHLWSHPHKQFHETWNFESGPTGSITIDQETAREMIMPLMMHGIPFYNWTYTIERDGYVTQAGSIYGIEKDEKVAIAIELGDGSTVHLDDFEQVIVLDLSMQRSNGGQLGGPIEVTRVPARRN